MVTITCVWFSSQLLYQRKNMTIASCFLKKCKTQGNMHVLYCNYLLNIVAWSQTLFLPPPLFYPLWVWYKHLVTSCELVVELRKWSFHFAWSLEVQPVLLPTVLWGLGGEGGVQCRLCNKTPTCVILVSLIFMYLNQYMSICLFNRQYEITCIFLSFSTPSPQSTKYNFGAIFSSVLSICW